MITRNKKGLSEIVTTMIIILLSIVAIGIIWVVVRNVINTGTQQVDISSKCLAVSLSAVSVNESPPGIYAVTLKRDAGGSVLGGIKISVFNSTGSSGVMDFGTLAELQTKTVSMNTSNATQVVGGHKIEYTPFFLDASGNTQLCGQATHPFTF